MTDTMPANAANSPARVTPETGTQTQQICLVASFIVSGVGLLFATIGFWLVRRHNELAAAGEASGPIKNMMSPWTTQSNRPIYLFLMFVVGVAALVLAFIGARATREAWVGVLAGALAMTILMVPLVVLANDLLTAGLFPDMGD